MTQEEALRILIEYNEWRRGADTPQLDPKIIGEAIDKAIEILKENVR